jgi:hypothetical protein
MGAKPPVDLPWPCGHGIGEQPCATCAEQDRREALVDKLIIPGTLVGMAVCLLIVWLLTKYFTVTAH